MTSWVYPLRPFVLVASAHTRMTWQLCCVFVVIARYFESCAFCVREGGFLFVATPRAKLPWVNKAPWFLRRWASAARVVIEKVGGVK